MLVVQCQTCHTKKTKNNQYEKLTIRRIPTLDIVYRSLLNQQTLMQSSLKMCVSFLVPYG